MYTKFNMENIAKSSNYLTDFFEEISKSSHKQMRKNFLYSQRYKNFTLDDKIKWSKGVIKEFLIQMEKEGYSPTISFSGGKDSCVVFHLVQEVWKELGAARERERERERVNLKS